MNSEAQSEVIGVILLLSISITAIGVILLFGQPIITGASDDVNFNRMENEFALLDARISSSVLGASGGQTVSLNVENGQLYSNPDAAWMRVEWTDDAGNTEKLANITMGNLRYVQGDRTLAYEGGGVWRSNEGEDFTEMVAPPEFHYKGSTLTLPAYDVESDMSVAGTRNTIRIESSDEPELLFPDKDLDNPLEEGNVTVTIKSEYYRGWESFLRGRTTGAIKEVREDEQKVIFGLEVPTELALTAGIMYQSDADVQGSGDISSAAEIDVDLPEPETIVNPEISKCIPGGGPNCVDLTTLSDGDELDEDKIYYVDAGGGDYIMDEDYHAPDSNVTILINGNLKYNNEFAVGDSSADPVEVYVDGDLDAQSAEINTQDVDVSGTQGTGVASSFVTYATGGVPGSGSTGFGNSEYTGVIFAPNTYHGSPACSGGPNKIAGTAEIKGTLIGESVCLQGNSGVSYKDDLDFLDLSPDVSLIRYLHISENDIRLSG